MNIPKRWQRSRAKGAKQPESCFSVVRGTRYGNLNKVMKVAKDCYIVDFPGRVSGAAEWLSKAEAHERAVEFYGLDMTDLLYEDPAYFDPLLDFEWISCFCPLHLPCHCDPIIKHLEIRYKILTEQK